MLKQKFSDEIEVGCDEAGRGCLAGPVVAAAVLLPGNFKNSLLNDSKQLSKKKQRKFRNHHKKRSNKFRYRNCISSGN